MPLTKLQMQKVRERKRIEAIAKRICTTCFRRKTRRELRTCPRCIREAGERRDRNVAAAKEALRKKAVARKAKTTTKKQSAVPTRKALAQNALGAT